MSNNWAENLDIIDQAMNQGIRKQLVHNTVDDQVLDGRRFSIGNRPMTTFGSCSYLGLEMDPRVKRGVVEATERFGSQFCSSRAYVSAPPYAQAEAMLEALFEAPVLVTPTTTLGHLSALPVLIGARDLVVLDQQVHHSVQMAAQLTLRQGARLVVLRHNAMARLEAILEWGCAAYEKVWYLADGVYSMYGDLAPMDHLVSLLDRHDKFHLYLDDAHGMSWTGRQGRGTVLGQRRIHERMIVAVSFCKAFAAAGGGLVFPNRERLQRVRNCAGPMTFSGPIQPPMLGALVASCRIHLSPEIHQLQDELKERIQHCIRRTAERGLPVVSREATPVRFLGIGDPVLAEEVVSRLMERGFFVNICEYPAVPMKRAGVRFTLTRHHQLSDIDAFLETVADILFPLLERNGTSVQAVREAFGLDQTVAPRLQRPA